MTSESGIMLTSAQKAAELLARAERDGPIPKLPDVLLPASRDDAYSIQDILIGSPKQIGGWKVTVPKPGELPACAPIAKTRIFRTGTQYTPPALITPELEGEIAIEIGQDLPRREVPYGRNDIAMAIRATLPAIEILGSRYLDRKAAAPLAVLADLQSNAGIAVGPGCPGWTEIDFSRAKLSALVNDGLVASTDTGSSGDEVLDALVWLANHAAVRCGGLREGQIIITGARIKPFKVKTGDRVIIDVGGVGTVAIDIAAR
jgi:2-keto-4-pentenoate hydratase